MLNLGSWASSKGMVKVPNLSGLTNAEAINAITNAHLIYSGSSSTSTSYSNLDNTIASQLPNPNDLVDYGSSVSFIYYTYTAPVPSPVSPVGVTPVGVTPVGVSPVAPSGSVSLSISSTGGNNYTLNWSTSGTTQASYKLFFNGAGFWTETESGTTGSSSSGTVSGTTGTVLYWYVQVVGSDGYTYNSNTVSKTIQDVSVSPVSPVSPVGVSPTPPTDWYCSELSFLGSRQFITTSDASGEFIDVSKTVCWAVPPNTGYPPYPTSYPTSSVTPVGVSPTPTPTVYPGTVYISYCLNGVGYQDNFPVDANNIITTNINTACSDYTNFYTNLGATSIACSTSSQPAMPSCGSVTPVGVTPVGVTPVGVTPVGVTPVGVTPVGVTPVGVTPVGVTPVGVTPVGVTPVGVTPVGVTPVGVTPVGVTPVGVTPVGASCVVGDSCGFVTGACSNCGCCPDPCYKDKWYNSSCACVFVGTWYC